VRAADIDELLATPDAPAGDVGLLPGFDPWVICPRTHRDRAVPAGFAAAVSRTSGWISPVLVADGAVVGTWEHAVADGVLTVTVAPFGPLAKDVRIGAEAAAAATPLSSARSPPPCASQHRVRSCRSTSPTFPR
jgi:hypothetical protein